MQHERRVIFTAMDAQDNALDMVLAANRADAMALFAKSIGADSPRRAAWLHWANNKVAVEISLVNSHPPTPDTFLDTFVVDHWGTAEARMEDGVSLEQGTVSLALMDLAPPDAWTALLEIRINPKFYAGCERSALCHVLESLGLFAAKHQYKLWAYTMWSTRWPWQRFNIDQVEYNDAGHAYAVVEVAPLYRPAYDPDQQPKVELLSAELGEQE